ncbi:MAG: LysM peptidoglycan-binding domain-containing protein [Mangrovibacterium sp.]
MKHVLLILAILISSLSFAQQVKSYTVKSGETIYSICKRNDITQEQLEAANPSLRGNLRAGQIIQIPVIQKKIIEPQVSFENHKVKRKETLYGISKKYGLSVDDILKYNPWAEKGIKKKDILRIPKKTEVIVEQELELQVETSVSKIKHEVKSGETLYGLAKKYHRSIEALLTENPKAAQGLKVGMVLTISEIKDEDAGTKDSKAAYTVKAGDTVYRIVKTYGITVEEFYEANPEVKAHGLQTDMVISIPTAVQKVNQVEEWTLQPAEAQPNIQAKLKEYHIALLLPLSAAEYEFLVLDQPNRILEAAQNDSIEYTPKTDAELISAKSRGFLQMYQGVLLAVEKMRMQGMQVSVRLFDTESSLLTVKNIVEHPDFKRADLIIGPVYPQIQDPVVNFSRLNHIPMISPLSSAGNFEDVNPYYYKVNPTDKLIHEKTEAFLADNFKTYNLMAIGVGGIGDLNQSEEFNQNFAHVMMHDVTEPLADLTKEETEAGVDPNLLRRKLDYAKDTLQLPTVAYIPFDAEAKVSVGVNALNAAVGKSSAILVGQYNFTKYKSIQAEYYHRLNLHVLSPYYIDYASEAVNEFVKLYRENYYSEPSQFAFQGYDVTYYFMNMLFNFGNNISSAVVSYRPKLLQCDFNFKKLSPSAGWVNEGLFLLEYKPDYTIVVRD